MGLISFGVRKPVPVNLIMVTLIVWGIWAALSTRRAFFPEVDPESAQVELSYPGASPEEIEESLAIKVEDALADLDEVEELSTTLSEGGGGIVVKFHEGVDIDDGIDEVERAVDALTDLPDDAERIKVRELEVRLPVIRVTLDGDVDEAVLKRTLRAVRDDLRALGGMGEIDEYGLRDYEIRVDVRGLDVIEHGMSLPQVRDLIAEAMTELPGGTVRSRDGNINVRTLGTKERAETIRRIVLRSSTEGDALRVGDIAEVTETFVDRELMLRHNGRRAVGLTVYKVGSQDIVDIAERIRSYADGRSGRPFEPRISERIMMSDRHRAWRKGASADPLPEGTEIHLNSDFARFVEGRLNLLIRNASYGAILVFATLLAVLNWRAALWVGVGLLTALLGTLVLMLWLDVTLNLLTMFGLIVVLGLLVDDAIVVSENILARHDRGESALEAAISGAGQVAWPVAATVLTTVVAFLPLAMLEGNIGDLLGALPTVVACALLMSLVESMLILPSHLGHSMRRRDGRASRGGRVAAAVARFEKRRDVLVFERLVPAYARLLDLALRYRYISVCIAIATLIVSVGLSLGGRVPYRFLPKSDAETIAVDLRMPVGTPIEKTGAMANVIETAARAQTETKSTVAIVGERSDIDTGTEDIQATHIAQFFIELKTIEQRERRSSQVVASIRREIADKLVDIESIRFTELGGQSANPDITLRLRGDDEQEVADLAFECRRILSQFDGVHDVADDHNVGQRELQIELQPGAAALGFTTAGVARQVRGAVYGLEAHVFSARGEDIDVRVRLDPQTRRSLHAVEHLWIMSPADEIVPLAEVASLRDGLTYATIKRIDRKRAITVTADCDPQISPETITARLPLDELRRRYPRVEIELAGRQKQQREAFGSLTYSFGAAMIMIFFILAWLFDSYVQPLVVMVIIPFGLIGVTWGHFLTGFDISFLSMIGFVALAGIVVNDSLILVDFYNQQRAKGMSVREALMSAGPMRLRAILLTTITTVLGLTPLMLEQSFQARFLIPMAVSISFGLMGATVLILLFLPCVMLIMDDVRRAAGYVWRASLGSESGSTEVN